MMSKKICKFYIDNCFHCNQISGTFAKLAEKYKNEIDFENKRVESSLMEKKYNLHIYPTVVVYEDGKEIDRIEGVIPPEVLKDFVEEAL